MTGTDEPNIAQRIMNESIIDSTSTFIGENDITKAEAMADVSKRFFYMQQLFFRAGKMKTKMNDVMIQLYFHAVVGAYLKEYTIIKGGGVADLRIPLIWVQNSRSGKSQLNNVAIDVSKRIGMKAVESTEFSTPGMIGTFDRAKHDHNVKNNLHPGDDMMVTDKNGNTKRKAYQVPITYGDMFYNDLIFIDEAKILFEKSKFTENILSVLQPALDYPGRIRKKLSAEEPIEYDCTCTVVASTVEWGRVGMDIMSQGYFPRCLFYSKSLSIRDYKDMATALTELTFNEEAYHSFINDFAEVIEKHKFPLNRDRKKIMVRPECLEVINSSVQKWFDMIGDKLYGSEAHVAKPFASGLHQFIYKIAGQMAVLNHKINPNVVTETVYIVGMEEVEYAINILDLLFGRLISTMSIEETQEDKNLYSTSISVMKMMCEQDLNEIPKREVMKMLMTIRSVGRQKAVKLYTVLCSANFFHEKAGPAGEVMVVPNWKLWLEKDNRVPKDVTGGIKDDKTNMQEAQKTGEWD
jgi:hypothetical protein